MRKLQAGEPVLGAAVSVSDPTITEALADSVDFVWIDQEHNPLSMGEVQGHIMATKGAPATPIVRVPWNDHVMIKRVLDAGAAGIIVPMVRTAAEARRAVEACLYPPAGIRGYGPRRPSNYGRHGGVDFVREANASVIRFCRSSTSTQSSRSTRSWRCPASPRWCSAPTTSPAAWGCSVSRIIPRWKLPSTT